VLVDHRLQHAAKHLPVAEIRYQHLDPLGDREPPQPHQGIGILAAEAVLRQVRPEAVDMPAPMRFAACVTIRIHGLLLLSGRADMIMAHRRRLGTPNDSRACVTDRRKSIAMCQPLARLVFLRREPYGADDFQGNRQQR